jgi:adenosylmethionine-8-amino-7-oxononanoate aminotransferase
VIIRALGDVVAMCPPLVISEAELDAFAATIGEAIRETERDLRR